VSVKKLLFVAIIATSCSGIPLGAGEEESAHPVYLSLGIGHEFKIGIIVSLTTGYTVFVLANTAKRRMGSRHLPQDLEFKRRL
jgi:hypothetical protein